MGSVSGPCNLSMVLPSSHQSARGPLPVNDQAGSEEAVGLDGRRTRYLITRVKEKLLNGDTGIHLILNLSPGMKTLNKKFLKFFTKTVSNISNKNQVPETSELRKNKRVGRYRNDLANG